MNEPLPYTLCSTDLLCAFLPIHHQDVAKKRSKPSKHILIRFRLTLSILLYLLKRPLASSLNFEEDCAGALQEERPKSSAPSLIGSQLVIPLSTKPFLSLNNAIEAGSRSVFLVKSTNTIDKQVVPRPAKPTFDLAESSHNNSALSCFGNYREQYSGFTHSVKD